MKYRKKSVAVMTRNAVAERLGVSVETVRQDELSAMEKLRVGLADLEFYSPRGSPIHSLHCDFVLPRWDGD